VRILIADDDPVSCRLLEATLVRQGHEVVAVANGTDAMKALLSPDGPRLAILDWMMPGADGLTVCRAMRQRPAPYVYVILLTARNRREDRAAGLDAEADDFLTKPFDAVELRARLRCGERVIQLQADLLEAQEALRVEANYDRLTGLSRREVVLDQLDREVARARREGRPLAVLMTDLDHFKQVNDTYGHPAGDAILRQSADRLRSVIREYDFIGRYGGEEFLLVLPGCSVSVAQQIAERARTAIGGNPMQAGRAEMPMTVSLGLAWTSSVQEDGRTLLLAADDALYRAKARGRNRVEAQVFDEMRA
jgi:two-component system, cell cycle response regulator